MLLEAFLLLDNTKMLPNKWNEVDFIADFAAMGS